jgi:hypothetical protein
VAQSYRNVAAALPCSLNAAFFCLQLIFKLADQVHEMLAPKSKARAGEVFGQQG